MNEIKHKLTELALKRSIAFCYSCYQEVSTGWCKLCGSDDLMRLLPEFGCEYGTDWVVEQILKTELNAVDLEAAFEQSVRDFYPEVTTVAWCTFDTVELLKENDPISWRCALSEYELNEESEGNILTFDGGSTYYFASDIEKLIE